MNPNEPGILQFFMLYLIFQVGLSTFFRALDKIGEHNLISKRDYIIMMVPVLGIIYTIYRILSFTLSDKK